MFILATINCNGLREPLKIDYLKSVIENENIDICFVQESHVENNNLGKFIERRLNAKTYWSYTDNSKHKGVGIVINNSFDCDVKHIDFDSFGRYVCVDLKFNDYEIRCISIYAPNNEKERKDFFQDIYKLFVTKNAIILGGDFNCVGNLEYDKKGGNKDRGNGGWEQLFNICKDFNLIDCFRHNNPSTKEYTWSSQGVSCRLDRFYISKCLSDVIEMMSHKLYTLSDHKLALLKLLPFNHQKIGNSYWKFNATLLKDPDYIDFMTLFLKNNVYDFPNSVEILEWWDNLKNSIKSVTIDYAKNKNKRKRQIKNILIKEFNEYEKNGDYKSAQLVKEQIKQLDLESVQGAQIRSKAMQLEGEKPSKYFLYKELQRNKKKNIKKIIGLDNKETSDSEEILNNFKIYYQNLFKYETIDINSMTDLLTDLPLINENDNCYLGNKVSQEEILSSLKSFQNNKSPGCDGLTKEFYLAFIDVLLPVLSALYDMIFESGQLSPSQKVSYITLLCKDSNHPESMSNYRPISLLNVDNKILTKALSKRLESVLEQIIHPDQSCGVPKRSIIDNCHLIRDIIDYANIKNINGILLSLDQEKAFDKISHQYLFETLKAFGFGDSFISWIKAIYNDVSSNVIVNHFISDSFPVQKSVRQGCCLSPLLYVICLEPVLIRIRKDTDVKGFKIPGREEQKITAFADDSNFTLSDDVSVKKVIYHFEYFGMASGSKLNKHKSQGLYLGKWKTRSDHPFGISWVKKIKIFGIFFGEVSNFEIWNPVYKKIVKTLNLYKSRCMSLYGKALIVNVMVLSKLWYLCSVLCLPEYYVVLIEREIFNFIWDGKIELLRRNICYFRKSEGGINLVDVRLKISSLHLSQISKIIYRQDLTWTYFGNIWLGIKLKRFSDYYFTNLIPHCIEDLPSFYEKLRNILDIVKNNDIDITFEKNISCKMYYQSLLDAFVEKERVPNIISKYPTIDFSKVFENVCNKNLDPTTVNVTFKLAHGILPVAYRLHSFGINIDKMCTFCKNEFETVDHLFFFCRHIQDCKKILASWFFNVSNCGISKFAVLFSSFSNQFEKNVLNTIMILLSEYRHCIWTMRNKMRFERKHYNAKDIAIYFFNRIKCRILVDMKRLGIVAFRKLWDHVSICTLEFGNITMNDKLLRTN